MADIESYDDGFKAVPFPSHTTPPKRGIFDMFTDIFEVQQSASVYEPIAGCAPNNQRFRKSNDGY